jgi:hypothetical protein
MRERIRVATRDGSEVYVDADVFGGYAVHHPVEGPGRCWAVTNVASGLSVHPGWVKKAQAVTHARLWAEHAPLFCMGEPWGDPSPEAVRASAWLAPLLREHVEAGGKVSDFVRPRQP